MNHHSTAARVYAAISDEQDSQTDTNNSIDENSNEYISPHTQLIKTMISIVLPEDNNCDKDELDYVVFG